MGQATADLPDPLEERPEPGGSNDELLSQLAGEEIDRLLADDAAGAPAAQPQPPQATMPEGEPAKDLGAFLNDVDGGKRPVDDAAGAVHNDFSQGGEPTESEQTDAAERAALDVERLDEAIGEDPNEGPTTLLLRPLVWISAPLEMLPDGVRAGVGKVAIVTFFNAIAILIYVLIFRR